MYSEILFYHPSELLDEIFILFTPKKRVQTSASKKNFPNKKGYIGFVGSQPMLLLFDACLNIWCKSNNIGCDTTNPMYPFLFGEFFY